MTRDTVRFRRHQNVGRFMALLRLMTNVAIEWFLRRRIDLVFGVVEISLRHPAIDQNRFCNRGRAVCDGLHFVTKSAASEISARGHAHRLLWLVRIFGEENRAFELVPGMKLVPQLFDLLGDKTRDLTLGNSLLQALVV